MNKRLAENIVFYFLGFFIISIFLVIAFLVSSVNFERNIESEFRTSVANGVSNLEGLQERIELLNSVINKDQSFNSFAYKSAKSNSLVASQKHLNNLYRNLCLISNDISYIFTVFLDNSSYISSGDTSLNFNDYFDKFIDIDVMGRHIETSREFESFLLDNYHRGVSFLRLDNIRYISSNGITELKDPLLILESSTRYSSSPFFITGYLISAETLKKTLLNTPKTMEASIRIRNIQDQSIIYDNYPEVFEKEDYYTYEGLSSKIKCFIEVMIPKNNLRYETLPVSLTLFVILSGGIVSGICFAVYYGTQQYKKTRNLIQFLETNGMKVSKQRDVAEIQKRIIKLRDEGESYRNAAEELERTNTLIQFQNIITKGVKTSEDAELLEEMIPFASSGYHVVVMRAVSGSSSGPAMLLFETLDKSPYKGALTIHSGSNEDIFIIPIRDDVEDISSFLEKFMTHAGYTILHFGLSPSSREPRELPELYDKAESAVVSLFAYTNENKLRRYDDQNRNALMDITNIENLSKLKNLLLRGQYQELEALFNGFYQKVLAFPLEAEERKEDIYYHIKGIYQDVINTLDITGLVLEQYDERITLTELRDLFLNWTRELGKITSEVKKSHNNDLLDKIVNFVEKHYSNPSLSAYEVSSKVNVSEKYLQSFFREQMGTSFSQYLLVLRLTEAKKLLETSDFSNEQIASMVGFGAVNTFYRNFNKFYGVSPKTYKEGLINSR